MKIYQLQADANGNKGMFRLYCDDELIKEELFRVYEDAEKRLKRRTITALTKGLLYTKDFLTKDDVLIIELNNQHLIKWLVEEREYTGYDIQKILKILNQLPCHFEIAKTDLTSLKRYIKNHDVRRDRELDIVEILLREMDEDGAETIK